MPRCPFYLAERSAAAYVGKVQAVSSCWSATALLLWQMWWWWSASLTRDSRARGPVSLLMCDNASRGTWVGGVCATCMALVEYHLHSVNSWGGRAHLCGGGSEKAHTAAVVRSPRGSAARESMQPPRHAACPVRGPRPAICTACSPQPLKSDSPDLAYGLSPVLITLGFKPADLFTELLCQLN